VQTKLKYGGLIRGGHKIIAVENVSEHTTVVQAKDTLKRQKCGIKATGINMRCGRTLMANHQTLGDFPGLHTVRAMDAFPPTGVLKISRIRLMVFVDGARHQVDI
jgi:hypothetical protein